MNRVTQKSLSLPSHFHSTARVAEWVETLLCFFQNTGAFIGEGLFALVATQPLELAFARPVQGERWYHGKLGPILVGLYCIQLTVVTGALTHILRLV